MTTFHLTSMEHLIKLHPDKLIRALFRHTRKGILYVEGFPSLRACVEDAPPVYRCRMSWCEDDCSLISSELSSMCPEEEPDGFFIEEVSARGKRLQALIEMGAPRMVIFNEANLLLIAIILNRFASNLEIIKM